MIPGTRDLSCRPESTSPRGRRATGLKQMKFLGFEAYIRVIRVEYKGSVRVL